jgi:hypothetical protein
MLTAAMLSACLGVLVIFLATRAMNPQYGLALFCATPLLLSVAAPLVHGIGAPRSFLQCLAVSMLCQLTLFFGMLVFGIEGILCVIMAAPLWLAWATVGALVAYPLHRLMWREHRMQPAFPLAALALVTLLPLLSGAERQGGWRPPLIELTSTIEIDAPPEVVWERLVSFPEMPRPQAWPFRYGIAYPVRADLDGRGVNATRYCVFSTGAAAERVTAWDEPRVLAFNVLNTPPPMVEWSPFQGLQPPHLTGYLQSRAARFELTALPGNRTRLVGTSWYANRMYPAAYWQLWSDTIIRDVHRAVFAHVKSLAEADARAGRETAVTP